LTIKRDICNFVVNISEHALCLCDRRVWSFQYVATQRLQVGAFIGDVILGRYFALGNTCPVHLSSYYYYYYYYFYYCCYYYCFCFIVIGTDGLIFCSFQVVFCHHISVRDVCRYIQYCIRIRSRHYNEGRSKRSLRPGMWY